jgi:uncharacterized SAM-binding protein YcdF (DUF218 family)
MILRLFSILFLLYLFGFLVFAVTLGQPAGDERTESVVVVTGGSGRIEHGIDSLAKGLAKRMLISGTDPVVTKSDLVERLGGQSELVECCIDLGSESVDTRSNAEEAKRWLDRQGYTSLRLVTSDWHMRRARYEFRRVLGDQYEIVPDAVTSHPTFRTLFFEYYKFLLRRAASLFEI